MAGIKDKLITVETLSTVYENIDNTYMTKVDPTGSGTMTFDGNVNMHAYSDEYDDTGEIKRDCTIESHPNYFSVSTQIGNDNEYPLLTNIKCLNGTINLNSTMGTYVDYINAKDLYAEDLSVIKNIYTNIITIDSTGGTDTLLQNTFNEMPNSSVRTFWIKQNIIDGLPNGGSWFVTIYKTNERYGVIKAIRYSPECNMEFSRSIYDGILHNWCKVTEHIESGIWSPICSVISAPTLTHGTYTKIGHNVTVSFCIHGISDAINDDTNNFIKISGLPFDAELGVSYAGGGIATGIVTKANHAFCGYVLERNVYSATYITPATISVTGEQKERETWKGINKTGSELYMSGTISYNVPIMYTEVPEDDIYLETGNQGQDTKPKPDLEPTPIE